MSDRSHTSPQPSRPYRMLHSRSRRWCSWTAPGRLGAPREAHFEKGPAGRSVLPFSEHQRIPRGTQQFEALRKTQHADLQKYFSKYPVCLFSKYRAENDSHSIMASLDVYCLLIPIMYRHDLPSFGNTFWRRLARVFRGLLLPLCKFVKSSFERCGHGIAFQ